MEGVEGSPPYLSLTADSAGLKIGRVSQIPRVVRTQGNREKVFPHPFPMKESPPMKYPQIDLLPSFSAVRSDAAVLLEVLVRITPPTPEQELQRPPVNLGLVLDRSGFDGSAQEDQFRPRGGHLRRPTTPAHRPGERHYF